MAYARILLRLGPVTAADSVSQLVIASRRSRIENANFAIDRVEIALKQGRYAEAGRLADSLRSTSNLGPIVSGVLGRTSSLPSLLSQIQGPDWVRQYYGAQLRAFLGLPADSLFELEKRFSDNITAGQGAARAANLTAATLLFVDPASRRGRWGALDSASSDPRIVMMSVLAGGDSARSARALARYDSIATVYPDEPDYGWALPGALGHLMLADTAKALASLRRFRDVSWAYSTTMDQVAPGFTFQGLLWPRRFLLLGDLAAARGHKEEAAGAYRRFLGMWEHGDPEVQPQVQRARLALARLGG